MKVPRKAVRDTTGRENPSNQTALPEERILTGHLLRHQQQRGRKGGKADHYDGDAFNSDKQLGQSQQEGTFDLDMIGTRKQDLAVCPAPAPNDVLPHRSTMISITIVCIAMPTILLGALCLLASTQAWTSPTVQRPICSSTLFASRAAAKWANKQQWLESRGGMAGDDNSSSSPPYAAIVGGGRIGSLLAEAGNCDLLGRGDSIDAEGTGPILIATRNDALEGIIDKCPENRRKDLVFLQNGYLDVYLESKGLLSNTQALLYLSVTAKGAEPIDGVTSTDPEGLTAATGEHAQAFADRLAALNLKCKILDTNAYKPAMFEKLM